MSHRTSGANTTPLGRGEYRSESSSKSSSSSSSMLKPSYMSSDSKRGRDEDYDYRKFLVFSEIYELLKILLFSNYTCKFLKICRNFKCKLVAAFSLEMSLDAF